MKFKLIPVLMILAGALFIYSAKVDDDPRNILFKALGSTTRVAHKTAASNNLGPGTFAPHTAGASAPAPTTIAADPTFRSV